MPSLSAPVLERRLRPAQVSEVRNHPVVGVADGRLGLGWVMGRCVAPLPLGDCEPCGGLVSASSRDALALVADPPNFPALVEHSLLLLEIQSTSWLSVIRTARLPTANGPIPAMIS